MSIAKSIHADAELVMIFSEEERRQAAAEHLPVPKPFRLTKTP
jgi:hypothetical protein